MKTKSIKAFIILLGLLLAGSIEAIGQTSERSRNFLTNNSISLNEIYISLAIIAGALLIYLVGKRFIKNEDVAKTPHKYTHHHNNNRHQRHIIRKTA